MNLRKNEKKKEDNARRSVENSSKTLLANIRFMRVDNPVRTVVITSAIPNEGKTYVAANLGRAMATSGVRTLVVECDMRRRSMAKMLNAHAQRGIYSVLSGEVALGDAVVQTSTPRMDFLDAEPHIPNPSDLLNSRRFSRLIEEAKSEYGYIVFDTPPVGTFVDAAVLGAKVDAVFMVVREQYTRKDEVARAADQLRTANVPLAGIVMNMCERQSNEYYYEYYYRESKGSSRSDAPMMPANSKAFAAQDTSVGVELQTEGVGRHAASRSWSNAPILDEDDMPSGIEGADADDDNQGTNANTYTNGRYARSARSISTLGQSGLFSRDDVDAHENED